MGCVPPYADVKTYLFQCKNCKHEWFEYEEIEENLSDEVHDNVEKAMSDATTQWPLDDLLKLLLQLKAIRESLI